MDKVDLIRDIVGHNRWANNLMVNWLRQHPSILFQTKVVSSFSSINKLLHHIMEAQKYYLSFLNQSKPLYSSEMDTDQIMDDLLVVDNQLLEWVDINLDNQIAQKVIELQRSHMLERYTVATLIQHVVIHSNYHRGQLIALRHQLHLKVPPKTDYYRYRIHIGRP